MSAGGPSLLLPLPLPGLGDNISSTNTGAFRTTREGDVGMPPLLWMVWLIPLLLLLLPLLLEALVPTLDDGDIIAAFVT